MYSWEISAPLTQNMAATCPSTRHSYELSGRSAIAASTYPRSNYSTGLVVAMQDQLWLCRISCGNTGPVMAAIDDPGDQLGWLHVIRADQLLGRMGYFMAHCG